MKTILHFFLSSAVLFCISCAKENSPEESASGLTTVKDEQRNSTTNNTTLTPVATPTPVVTVAPVATTASATPQATATPLPNPGHTPSPQVSSTPAPQLTPTTLPSVEHTPVASTNQPQVKKEEVLEKLKKANEFKNKLILAREYLSFFKLDNVQQNDFHELLVTIDHFRNDKKVSLDYDAFCLELGTELSRTLQQNIFKSDEGLFFQILDRRFKIITQDALEKLKADADLSYLAKVEMSLFKWNPSYLKRKNTPSKNDILEIKNTLIQASQTKALDTHVEMEKFAKKAFKHMNKKLPKNEAFHGEIKEILRHVDELI